MLILTVKIVKSTQNTFQIAPSASNSPKFTGSGPYSGRNNRGQFIQGEEEKNEIPKLQVTPQSVPLIELISRVSATLSESKTGK